MNGWERVFSSLPESSFFEVYRHYLGPVSTPFHKPEMMKKLSEFLQRDDVIRRSIEFIDELDAHILTCIDIYEYPTENSLRCLVPHISQLSLRERLLNLEERILIFRNYEYEMETFILTPLGIEIKNAGFLGPGIILGEPVGEIKESIESWLDDSFLTSALSFLLESHHLFKVGGGWRKKTLALIKERFPRLFHDDRSNERLMLAGNVLLELDLADYESSRNRRYEIVIPEWEGLGTPSSIDYQRRKSGKLKVNMDVWRDMEKWSRNKRRIHVISGIIKKRGLSLENALEIAKKIVNSMPLGIAYNGDRIANLIQIFAGERYPISPQFAHSIVSRLVLTGEFVIGENGTIGRPIPRKPSNAPCLTITPSGDFICHPELPLFCDLALTAEPVICDAVSSFRLEKNRYIKGLDAGIIIDSFVNNIEKYSGHPVPENLSTLMSEWETDYRAISLQFAVVLQVKGHRKKLLNKTHALRTLFIDHPAEGVWLLDYRTRKAWRTALEKVDIGYIPHIQGFSDHLLNVIDAELEQEEDSLPFRYDYDIDEPPIKENWSFPHFFPLSAAIGAFASHPAVQQLPEEEKNIFIKRLHRRLILVPEQIRPGSWRREIMTARGLDYQGKVYLAEMALAGRNQRLELTIPGKEDNQVITLIPKHMEKRGRDHTLVGVSLPDEQTGYYPIRKISFMKRIKMSIF